MYIGEWTELDEQNKQLIDKMLENHEIAYGLMNNNRAVTLNMLIDFCKEQNINFDKPIFLECPNGYFPLAHSYNGTALNDDGEEYNLDVLVLMDGEW